MSYRSKTISKLLTDGSNRRDYIKAKLDQVIPSQIRALRLREDWTQGKLADEAEMKQSRISAMESPGEVNFSLETLIRIAAAYQVGLWVEFTSHSEMVRRENSYSQDNFNPARLREDRRFLEPRSEQIPDHDYSLEQGHSADRDHQMEMSSSSCNGEIDVNHYSEYAQMGAMNG